MTNVISNRTLKISFSIINMEFIHDNQILAGWRMSHNRINQKCRKQKIPNLHKSKIIKKLGLETIFHTISVLYDKLQIIYSEVKTQRLSLENKVEFKDVHVHLIFTTKLWLLNTCNHIPLTQLYCRIIPLYIYNVELKTSVIVNREHKD